MTHFTRTARNIFWSVVFLGFFFLAFLEIILSDWQEETCQHQTGSFIHLTFLSLLDNTSAKRLFLFHQDRPFCPPPVSHNQVLMGWVIFSLFHWQPTSPVGIVCRSRCYIRNCEMKEFLWSVNCSSCCAALAALRASWEEPLVIRTGPRCWAGAEECL